MYYIRLRFCSAALVMELLAVMENVVSEKERLLKNVMLSICIEAVQRIGWL